MKYNYIVFQKPTANLIKPNKGGRRSKRGCHNGRGKHYRRHLFDTQSHVTLSLGKLSVAGLLQPREGKQRCVCAGRGGSIWSSIFATSHALSLATAMSGWRQQSISSSGDSMKQRTPLRHAGVRSQMEISEVSDGNKPVTP